MGTCLLNSSEIYELNKLCPYDLRLYEAFRSLSKIKSQTGHVYNLLLNEILCTCPQLLQVCVDLYVIGASMNLVPWFSALYFMYSFN